MAWKIERERWRDCALDVAHVARELSELAELREARPAEVARRIPGRVMRAGLRGGAELLARRRLGLQDLEAALHVRIDRLAGDEEMLDLARPFEDAVDAHVAHDPLDRIALLAALAQRLRGLVSASAADLHEVIDASATPTSVLNSFAIAASRRRSTLPRSASPEVSHTIASIANVCDAIQAIFAATASCLPIGAPHCTRSFAHSLAMSTILRPAGRAAGGNRQAAGVQRDQRELEAEAFAPEEVLVRERRRCRS